jgi:hypothetical protein
MHAIRSVASTLGFCLLLAGNLAAQAAAPKDATGQCTDGSYTTAKTQERGCTKHGGVKTWFGGGAASAATTAAPAPKASASEKTAAPAPKASASASTGAAPKDATGQCTDGSYTTAKTQQRGCTKHGGVKTWYGAAAATAASAPAAPTSAAPTPPAPAAAAPAPAPTPAAAPARAAAPAQAAAQAPANPSDVWVNTSTKAYHCPGTKYYGTTKHGKYMSEADAKAAGFHPSYGKVCS